MQGFLHGLPRQGRVHDRAPIVRKSDGPFPPQGLERGEAPSLLPAGDRPHRVDAHHRLGGNPLLQITYHRRTIQAGRRIRHGEDRGEATRRRGLGAAHQGLFVLLAGNPQMDVDVHEPGKQRVPREIVDLQGPFLTFPLLIRGQRGGRLHDSPVAHEQVPRSKGPGSRVDQQRVREEEIRSSQAIVSPFNGSGHRSCSTAHCGPVRSRTNKS